MDNKNFCLDEQVNGVSVSEYMAGLLEKNENNELEIERGKLAIGVLKQMNNRSRLLLDVAKFELKCKEQAATGNAPTK